MTIINKLNDKASGFVAPPIPTFRTKYEEDKYWDIEWGRCINGYNSMPGRYYAYLTLNYLKTVTGETIRPDWRDGDQMIFEEDEAAGLAQEDLMIVKRREIGLTSIYGGFEPIYNCLFNPGSVNVLTSADYDRVKKMFSEKTMVSYANLPIPGSKIPPILRKNKDGSMELGREDSKGKPLGPISVIVSRQTSKDDESAKNLESLRAMSIFLDELFLHPRAGIVHNSAQACIRQDFIKIGRMRLGGSCGATNKAEEEALKKGAQLGQELWEDSVSKGIRTVFIPGWMCIDKVPEFDKDGSVVPGKIIKLMKNGHSDQKGATAWIMQQRAKLEKAHDQSAYKNFIKQYPLTIEEVWEINRDPVFPESVYEALAAAKRAILSNNRVGLYKLYRESNIIL